MFKGSTVAPNSVDSNGAQVIFSHRTLALSILLIFAVSSVRGAAECKSSNCTLENYFRSSNGWIDRIPCKVAKLIFPTDEAELVQAVSQAVQHGNKIKVVSKHAHTYSKFACPNSLEHLGVLISTSKFNSSIVLDKESMLVTCDPGVQLRALVDFLAKEGFALRQSIYWDGVSVSGMVSTGAHGSSLWNRGGGTYEYLVGMRFVVPASAEEGFARVVDLKEGQDDFKAARISLGVLGAISKLGFRVEPMFKRSITLQVKDDHSIEDEIVRFGTQHEFGDITWYPGSGKGVFRVDDRVPVTTPGDAVFTNGFFDPVLASAAKKNRENEERLQAARNATGLCTIAQQRINSVLSSGGGLLNDGKSFSGFPAVGFNHKMQSYGGCQNTYEDSTNLKASDRQVCVWDYNAHGNFFFHLSVGLHTSKMKSFIQDVKQLRDKDPSKLCSLDYNIGIQMRYVKASNAYLGEKEDVVETEFLAFRDRRPGYPQPFEDIVEEIEQMMVLKYNGRPHFGKNRNAAFVDLGKKARNLPKFLQVKTKMDPHGWFSSDWSDAVLGIRGKVSTHKPGCALEGLCFCTKDVHCAPDKGYFCKPGSVYKNARVCKLKQ